MFGVLKVDMSTQLPPTLEPLIADVVHHFEAHLRAVLMLQRDRDAPGAAEACKDHYEALTKAVPRKNNLDIQPLMHLRRLAPSVGICALARIQTPRFFAGRSSVFVRVDFS